MSENPVHCEQSKNIDHRVHSLRERVAAGEVVLVDCSTHDMVANSLTKNLPAEAFHHESSLGCSTRLLCVMGPVTVTVLFSLISRFRIFASFFIPHRGGVLGYCCRWSNIGGILAGRINIYRYRCLLGKSQSRRAICIKLLS